MPIPAETERTETPLSGKELGARANQLMDPIIEMLKHEPSVLSSLADRCFSSNFRNMDPISVGINRGGTRSSFIHIHGKSIRAAQEKSLAIAIGLPEAHTRIRLDARYDILRENGGFELVGGSIEVRHGSDEPITNSEEAVAEASRLLAPLLK